ncbi:hypothetical protein F2P81_023230 [Scophthalmus maximus]|uniref:Protein OSCP1 n=1 Tax=Scophthalmus maximus TaxID=52904 RepID=A0A6A4RWZ0_SCOMX|nr:hypothetical protein F2P81_023230 [Scophthalmus maximus]
MSVRTLPLVFINLGGEMIYILDQRLRASNTSDDNSEKVMNDIVGTMFSKAFIDELLKPQQLYSHRTLKTVLTRLAHASIMRLNPASMERLYELMVMAFKYQVFLCPRPKDLLLISYNHIDTIREFVKDTPVVVNQVDETHRKIIETSDAPNLLAKEELNLLARLMGSMKAENKTKVEAGFQINLFTTDQEEEEAGDPSGAEDSMSGVINIQAMQDEQAATELARIAGQFTEQEEPENPYCNKGDDLLAMMDDL